MPRSRNPSQGDGSKPRIHITHTGGRYIHPEELLRAPKVKEAIDTMAEIARSDQKEDNDNSHNG